MGRSTMAVDLQASAILSEITSTNPVTGVSGGPNLAHGTVREMIAAALALPEDRFRASFVSVLPEGPTIRPDEICEIAEAEDIEADDTKL